MALKLKCTMNFPSCPWQLFVSMTVSKLLVIVTEIYKLMHNKMRFSFLLLSVCVCIYDNMHIT